MIAHPRYVLGVAPADSQQLSEAQNRELYGQSQTRAACTTTAGGRVRGPVDSARPGGRRGALDGLVAAK